MFRGSVRLEQMSSNRSITDAWRAHQHREHQERIKHVKHALDNKPPKQYPHLSTRYKKEQAQEERYRQIEQDNRLLLQRMAYIMSHNQLDNSAPHPFCGSTAKVRVLNDEKVMADNLALLRRIQTQKPYYKRAQWAEHADRHDYYLRNLRQVPEPGTVAPVVVGSMYEIANKSRAAGGRAGSRQGAASPLPPIDGGADASARAAAAAGMHGGSGSGGGPAMPLLAQKLAAEHAAHYAKQQAAAAADKVGADELELLKEGRVLDGEHLIVTVTETKGLRGAAVGAASPSPAAAGQQSGDDKAANASPAPAGSSSAVTPATPAPASSSSAAAGAPPGAVIARGTPALIFRGYRFATNERSVVRVPLADVEALVAKPPSACDCAACKQPPATAAATTATAATSSSSSAAAPAADGKAAAAKPDAKSADGAAAAAAAAAGADAKTAVVPHPNASDAMAPAGRQALVRWLLGFLRFTNKQLTFAGRAATIEPPASPVKAAAASAAGAGAAGGSAEKKKKPAATAAAAKKSGAASGSGASPPKKLLTQAPANAAAPKSPKSPLAAPPPTMTKKKKPVGAPAAAVSTTKVALQFRLDGVTVPGGERADQELMVVLFTRGANKDWVHIGQTERVASTAQAPVRTLYVDTPKAHDVDLRVAVYSVAKPPANAPRAFIDHRDGALVGSGATSFRALTVAAVKGLAVDVHVVAAVPADQQRAAGSTGAGTPLGRLTVVPTVKDLGDVFDLVLTASVRGLAGSGGGTRMGPLLACYARNPNTDVFGVCGQTERLSLGTGSAASAAVWAWKERLTVRHCTGLDTDCKLAVFDVRDDAAAGASDAKTAAASAGGSIDMARDLRGFAVFSLAQFLADGKAAAAAAGSGVGAVIQKELKLVGLDGKDVGGAAAGGAFVTVKLDHMTRVARATAAPAGLPVPAPAPASPPPAAKPAATSASPAAATPAAAGDAKKAPAEPAKPTTAATAPATTAAPAASTATASSAAAPTTAAPPAATAPAAAHTKTPSVSAAGNSSGSGAPAPVATAASASASASTSASSSASASAASAPAPAATAPVSVAANASSSSSAAATAAAAANK